jgi:aspartyl protease family protein
MPRSLFWLQSWTSVDRRYSVDVFRAISATVVVLGLFSFALVGTADDAAKGASAKKPAKAPDSAEKMALEAAGIKVAGGNLTLPEEVEFSKSLQSATKQKVTLVNAERDVKGMEADIDENKKLIASMKVKHVELSANLANATNVVVNNQIVGALNALSGQIDLTFEKQKDAIEKLKTARSKASETREEFVQQLLSLRVMADSIEQNWSKLAADPALQKAVEAENKSDNGKRKLVPSSTFVAAAKKLEALEHAILSEVIPLTNEGGGLWATVMINGKHSRKMVVDSGATAISLPHAMAKEMGIEPTSRDQKIQVGLADGSQVPATLKTIDTVRVGKFSVENVECIILDPEAKAAPALLGMSFLGKFKFEVDTQKSELRMVKVDVGEVTAKPRQSGSKGKSEKK